MSDSEDSDLEEGQDVMRHQTKIVYQGQFPYIHIEPPDVIYERWSRIKPEVKQHVGHLMHVSVFWWPILLRQQDNHPTTFWAMEMGFLDSNVSNDLSLKRLKKIELLESILDAMERGLSEPDMETKARAVVSLSRLFSMEEDCLAEAIGWLLASGAPDIRNKLMDLGSAEIRYRTLCFIFNEYSRYLQVTSCSKKKAIQELKTEPDPWTFSKSEEMKNKGNEQFQKRKYDLALKWYSKAIKYHPSNHILYGNRALCYIRSEKYLKALGDGKRAIILQPDWAKGHYRFCDALFYLGEHQRALRANRVAQDACGADPEGHRDLQQQHERFLTELQESTAEIKTKRSQTKKASSKSSRGDSSGHHQRCSRQPEVLDTSVGRLRIKQQCTSIKKLMSKNERKLRRKQHQLATHSACEERKSVTAADDPKDPTAERETPRDCIYMDRVLHQIHDNKALFKEESVNISCILDHLRPWLDLFESKGHESVLNSRREPGALWELVDLLLESRNRVWARVFIQTLGLMLHIKPRLQLWAQQLDNAGLKAAESFVSRYSSLLEELDLKPLLTFTPLQETLIHTFGTVPQLFDRDGLTVMEYLRQAPAKEKRLFIWTLESNRERYHSCHFILDQYFEDDAVCLVIKKTDDEEHMSSVFKSKNRHRKKKQKELKSVFVLSGMRGGHSRDEEDEEDELFSEEDSLMFLNSMDPFSVPEHLRGQLEEFEEQYSGSSDRSHYQRILDNNPDPTKESLYDYFAQILEEHGPLCASDPLMMGELENFPPEAQQKISDAGGLESFLLESLRFVMMEQLIGLMKHAVSLTDLNPSAKEFWPPADASHISVLPYDHKDEFTSSDAFLLLPDPYAFDCHVSDLQEHTPASEQRRDKHTAVCVRDLAEHTDVSINTEPYVCFERNSGDMLQTEKQRRQLLKEIQQMKEDHEAVQQRRAEDISALQEETQKITLRMQIAGTELSMFQQKLEEVVRKDQQEKKENQETLKTLKTEIRDLADLHESHTRDISVKKKEYEAELERFLDVSNQCASERLSLEEEIKRFRDACVKAQRRSTMAQLCVLQSRWEHALRLLRMSVSEGKMVVKHLTEASLSFRSAALLSAVDDWKRYVCDVEDKLNRTQMELEAQMDQVKSGARLSSLPDVSVPSVPTAPALPIILSPPVPQPSGTYFYGPYGSLPAARTPTPTGRSTPQPADQLPEEPVSHRPSAPRHLSVYDRILERLHMMFPHYTRMLLNKFIQEVRVSSGGALNTLTYDDVINRVAQLILDHQENMRECMNLTGGDAPGHMTPPSDAAVRATGTPPPHTHVWKTVSEKHRNTALALNMEDPCIICHEDMSPEEVCVLECRHSFHRECIKSWLKEQSTCPTCREHALLPEDFPMLPGRQRRSQTPAAALN
ncbi:E3 ubiquitin-protein ligase TTC3-like [Carassius carassius]|uniref:E3 ubiquitin-protein ligase TTC3-like n=1 Tax=Carassius carassius TaxID=217509 RepID=UPI002869296E|nr:E3 ubiquitin-protein ligase TTC3-like [Carassius carassius]